MPTLFREPFWILLAALAVAALVIAWQMFVLWFYRLKAARPTVHHVTCADGWSIAIYHRPASTRRFAEPVLLCHGLAANHYFFDLEPPHSVAGYLAERGFECFLVEWRGTGRSARPPPGKRWRSYTVDDHIAYDAPALIDFALKQTGARRVFWLGHSLGGLIGYAIAQGAQREKLQGLLALGAPVFFARDTFVQRATQLGAALAWPMSFGQRFLGVGLAPFAGYVALPFTDFVLNPRNVAPVLQRRALVHVMTSMGPRVLAQFRDWVVNDAFRSYDRRTDYRAGLAHISVPLLVMAGSHDKLATPENARRQYELAASTDKMLVVFGRENGDRDEYGHGDLVLGTAAPDEVYPVIARWLEARATPIPPTPASE